MPKNYRDYFRAYGRPGELGEVRINRTICRPEDLDKPDRVAWYDRQAAEIVALCQSTIQAMQAYRQDLAARYAALETMPYTERLQILRRRAWRNEPVHYYVQIVRTLSDGTEVITLDEHFPGRERREALARFAALKRQRPGLPAVEDIAPRSWE